MNVRITEVTLAPGGTRATYPLSESDAKHDEELQLEPVPVPVPHHHPSEWLYDSSPELEPLSILHTSFSDTNSFISRA